MKYNPRLFSALAAVSLSALVTSVHAQSVSFDTLGFIMTEHSLTDATSHLMTTSLNSLACEKIRIQNGHLDDEKVTLFFSIGNNQNSQKRVVNEFATLKSPLPSTTFNSNDNATIHFKNKQLVISNYLTGGTVNALDIIENQLYKEIAKPLMLLFRGANDQNSRLSGMPKDIAMRIALTYTGEESDVANTQIQSKIQMLRALSTLRKDGFHERAKVAIIPSVDKMHLDVYTFNIGVLGTSVENAICLRFDSEAWNELILQTEDLKPSTTAPPAQFVELDESFFDLEGIDY
jgi:hypothetical protein